MKIKAVSECTGLTDRTIRYYIEEKLISPEYTKSYTGRRTFDFSPEDIEALKQISILRSFDITVEEIRSIQADPNTTPKIIFAAKKRLDASLSHARLKLSTLCKIKPGTPYTMREPSAELSDPKVDLPRTLEPVKRPMRKTIVSGWRLFLEFFNMFSALLYGTITFIVTLIRYKPVYPDWNIPAIIILLLSFLPGFVMLCIRKTKYSKNEILTNVLGAVCSFCGVIAFCSAMYTIGFSSVTTERTNYSAFDPHCEANSNFLFQELFPISPNFITQTVVEFGVTLGWKYAENS